MKLLKRGQLEWMDKLINPFNKYYSAMKRRVTSNEFNNMSESQMLMLSERSQIEKATFKLIPLM